MNILPPVSLKAVPWVMHVEGHFGKLGFRENYADTTKGRRFFYEIKEDEAQ
jgi:hypothetical protein